jgi:biotin carboxyl carrier protein
MTQRVYVINGNRYRVEVLSFDGRKAEVRVNSRTYILEVEGGETDRKMPSPATLAPSARSAPEASFPAPAASAVLSPTKPLPHVERPVHARLGPTPGPGQITAPMPGIVLKVLVKEGQSVGAGEALLILEAMKMENEIQAAKGGKIKEIHVEAGEEVRAGDPLVDLE